MLRTTVIGFIGAGTMGEVLIRGLIQSDGVPRSNILACDIRKDRLEYLAQTYGIQTTDSAGELVQQASVVLIAVKPQSVDGLLETVSPMSRQGQLTISIAAGVTAGRISEALHPGSGVIRAMPNAPASVLAGITALCPGPGSTPDDLEIARALFECVGRTVLIRNEALMDAVTGLSGSGPAYVYLAIEALSDAGVGLGISRSESSLLAAQTVFGAAKMLLDSGKSPGALRDLVATPGGTTVAGLKMLEKCNFRSAIMEAVEAAAARSRELGVLINRKKQA